MTQISSSELSSSAHAALGGVADVLMPGDDGYAGSAASLFADGTPDLVVRPRDADGVAAALRYAADAGLAVTVRSGGHSMAGLSTSADGMIIDTRRLSAVRVLDWASGRVRVGAGATWGAVAAALSPHGLGLTAGDTSQVGVGGLTLGGGIGWMVRRHGLAIDSLAAARLVTADGRLVGADAVEHADLFWALRGGGGNFGVAVSFDFTAQPVTSVHFGAISYQAGDLARFIAGWRDLMRASDEKLTTTLNLMPAVPGRPGSVTLMCCYASPDGAEAAEALRPFRALAPVASDGVRAMPYAEVLEDMAPLPAGLRMEVRNAFFSTLDDGCVAAADELFAGGGAALTLRSMGGAAARVGRDATAFAHRDAEVLVAAAFLLPQAAPPGLLDQALNRWSSVAVLGTGAYVGFLGSAGPADVAAAYPPDTYRRLAEVKRRYDPANVFRRTHNILPDQPRGGTPTMPAPASRGTASDSESRTTR
ncbi:MAG TPA: FAD-binding oxidoreductase [Streptosporangiaceae bacterium]|nr:FAD-binding oxidoreductase [Streptosporangiaceae bacterium]